MRFGVDVGRMTCSEGGGRGGGMLKKWGAEKSLTEFVVTYCENGTLELHSPAENKIHLSRKIK